eukprot:TRINITY_DN5026_c0_g1_i2.p1 TRINITY_DN5026_c0_g1~~TRINITY_DN5026_c0_g1_i2.p1  ORF type:complete len:195 (+),score=20.82 TRINITY_DN5026_c0_g1_i2:3-587(+)
MRAGFICLLLCAVAHVSSVQMTLTMLNDAAQSSGAVCLDGTPTGYYFSPYTNSANQYDWQIYFEGGGWCYEEADCWQRSKGALGSSKTWGTTMTVPGLLSDNCTINPIFCNFNRVYLPYCDGNSFSGNRDDVVTYNGDPLYFRGRRNLDATIQALLKDRNLSQAVTVMLTRSEERFSRNAETDLVCRLLLEKKK